MTRLPSAEVSADAVRSTTLISITGPAFAVGSMFCVQIGTALSIPLMLSIGQFSTTWLRLAGAAFVLWAVTRTTLTTHSWRSLGAAMLLGLAICGMVLFLAEAVIRIPLGMAIAIEFVGPLALAVLKSHRLLDICLALLAALGVALLTLTPSGFSTDVIGIVCALGAGGCWAAYILLTKQVGQSFEGLDGLTMSLMVAAIAATPFGLAQLQGNVTVLEIAGGLALGILVPAVPYGLEMLALRRMNIHVFGTLMSIEPAIAGLAGWLLLDQYLSPQKMAGILFIVAASACVTLSAIRAHRKTGVI